MLSAQPWAFGCRPASDIMSGFVLTSSSSERAMNVRSVIKTAEFDLSVQTAMPDQVWTNEADPEFSFLRSPMILKLRRRHPRFDSIYELLTRSILKDEVTYVVNLRTLEIVDAQPATAEPALSDVEQLARLLLTV